MKDVAMNAPEFLNSPRSKALGLLISCGEIFGHVAFTSAKPMQLFFMAVGCDDEAVVVQALFEWLKTGRRFPAPADIRELIAELAQPSTSTKEVE